MAEEFNPNAFRQQMAQQGQQIPAPVAAPPTQPVHQTNGQLQPQPYAAPTQAYQPQQAVQQHMPQQPHVSQQHLQQQQHAPQQRSVPYQGRPQPQPQPQPQQAHQQFQAQSQQGYAQPSQLQGNYQGGQQQSNHVMPEGAPEMLNVKKGNPFKRKNLISNMNLTTPEIPQMPGQMPGQMNAALNAIPTTGGVARPIVFVAGLALGVIGMTIGNMVFSGGEQVKVKAASNVSQLASEIPMTDDR